jgi:uncharacterized OB-fold protein
VSDREPAKPVPEPDAFSEGFWAAAARHVLAVQRCLNCGHLEHPPLGVCQVCRDPAPRFAFEPVSGKARLVSWTVMRDSFIPSFRADVPYAVGLVELVEQKGLRMIARLADGAGEPYAIGMPMEVGFDDVAPGVSLPTFRRASGADR